MTLRCRAQFVAFTESRTRGSHTAFASPRTARGDAFTVALDTLAGPEPLLRIEGLAAGYGNGEVLHGIDLRLGKGQSLGIIGPNGSGKSTILNSIFGLADIRRGRIVVGGRNVTKLGTIAKLRDVGIAYALPKSSLFLDLTVEQNLWLGSGLVGHGADERKAAESVFDRYRCLARRRDSPARSLSGGERRMLEIARALVMRPRILLVDEPSAGVEPAYLGEVFAALRDLRDRERMSIVMAETNAQSGLELADIGCVLVAGKVAMVGTGAELLNDLAVRRHFLDAPTARQLS